MNKQLITKEAVKEVFGSYWKQYKSRPWKTLVVFLFPGIGSIFVFYIPALMVSRIINVYAENGNAPLSSVAPLIAYFGISWFLGEIFWRVAMHYSYRLNMEGMAELNDGALARIVRRDYSFYANNFVGTLTRRVQAFSRGFESFTDVVSYTLIVNVASIIFALVVLSKHSLALAAVLTASIFIITCIVIPLVRRRTALVAERQDAGSRTTGRLSDILTNILAVKSFAQEDKEKQGFAEYVTTFHKAYIKAADFQNIFIYGSISPIYVLANVVGLVSAIFFSQQAGLPAGTILLVFTYYSNVTLMFWNIQHTYRTIENAFTEAAEFTQMLITPPLVDDKPGASSLLVTESRISFEAVGFGYGKKETGADKFLENFNLEIKGQERVGLVGPSGGGKTTITKLILRFLDPQSGRIAIDGQDIKEVTQESLRSAVSYVPQEPLLFHRSLFENIAYGKPDATEEEVIKAAKLAHVHEFISSLPQGYQTLVGERGVKLSGGQRQRVAIARAILKNAPILVLDEATSSLDSESEKYIQEGLWELMKGKTALVIAHRLSTIRHLDRIIVLNEGRIVEDGTHENLIKKGGLYAKLWSHQSGEFLADE